MKINLETMKELAEKLDDSGAQLEAMKVSDVCSMAYQLQYFFEAMDKITSQIGARPEYAKGDEFIEGFCSGTKSTIDILTNALVDKPE